MDFFCLRHPEPDIAPGLCYGQSDIPLAPGFPENFQRNLQKIKALGHSRKITRLYTSPLSRCMIPAQLISTTLSLPLQSDSRLMELNFGQWEGLSFDLLWANDKGYQHWCSHWESAAPPQGESLMNLIDRLGNFIEDNDFNQSLIVTHSGVIRALHHIFHKSDIKNFFNIKPSYGSISHFKDI